MKNLKRDVRFLKRDKCLGEVRVYNIGKAEANLLEIFEELCVKGLQMTIEDAK
ncbi:MAG: hypothetical protein GY858_00465 [Candidatus Omnitrophica bacterium]|nr:hypothetical protein [Candidatus Omnitrophota bacterium]